MKKKIEKEQPGLGDAKLFRVSDATGTNQGS